MYYIPLFSSKANVLKLYYFNLCISPYCVNLKSIVLLSNLVNSRTVLTCNLVYFTCGLMGLISTKKSSSYSDFTWYGILEKRSFTGGGRLREVLAQGGSTNTLRQSPETSIYRDFTVFAVLGSSSPLSSPLPNFPQSICFAISLGMCSRLKRS